MPLTGYEELALNRKIHVGLRSFVLIGSATLAVTGLTLGILGFGIMPLSQIESYTLFGTGAFIAGTLILALYIESQNAPAYLSIKFAQWNMGANCDDYMVCRHGYKEWQLLKTEDIKRNLIQGKNCRFVNDGSPADSIKFYNKRLALLRDNLNTLSSFPIITLQETKTNLADLNLGLSTILSDQHHDYQCDSQGENLVAWDRRLFRFIGHQDILFQGNYYGVAVDLLEIKSGTLVRVISAHFPGHDITNPSTEIDVPLCKAVSEATIEASAQSVRTEFTTVAAAPDLCCIGMDANTERNRLDRVIEAIEEAGFKADFWPEQTCYNAKVIEAQLDWIHVKGVHGEVDIRLVPENEIPDIPLGDPEKNGSDHKPVVKRIEFSRAWNPLTGWL